ncbi:MAG: DnaJ domain-containing protein [Bdellovibrionales bacterium]
MIDEGLELQWLQSFYEPWVDIPVVKGPRYSPTHQVLYTPLLAILQGIEECLNEGLTINNILSKKPFNESDLLKGIHLMAIQRLISFDPTRLNDNSTQDMNRLINLKEQLANKNAIEIFQFFGAGSSGSAPEVERVYKEVAKVHHPDKLPKNASPEKLELVKEVFTQITTAYDTLTNPDKRAEFDKIQRQKDAEKQLKAESILEDGIKDIKRGKFGDALILLEIANEMFPMPMAKLYIQWAKLKEYQNEVAPDHIMTAAKQFFDTFPAEFRKIPEFFHVQGLYQIAKGSPEDAETAFKRALAKDSSFIESRRELSAIKADSKTNPTISEILSGDLSVVISGIFNKKKSG